MKKLLLIQKDSPLKDYIELYLKQHPTIELRNVQSLSEAYLALNADESFDCIFIGHQIELDGEAKLLTEKLKKYLEQFPDTKVVGSNKGLATLNWVEYVPCMAPPHKVFDLIRMSLDLPPEAPTADYAAVPMFVFQYFKQAPCDIYFRLGKNEDASYIKRFNQEDAIEESDIAKYVEKGMKDVFIPSGHLTELSGLISEKLKSRSQSNNSEIDQLEVAAEAIDYASYVLNSLGINTKSRELVQNVVTDIISSATKLDKKKAGLFQKILNSKEDFYHKHVSLAAILSNAVLEELGWDKAEELGTTLTYAAFFHNFLINEENDILCTSDEMLSLIDSFERTQKIRDHAKMASDFVKDLPQIPYDAVKIILEHHGSVTGVGFPETKKNTTQLSSLFMVATDFALNFLLYYEKSNAADVQELLKKSLATFGASQKKILEALQNVITAQMIG